MSYTVLSTSRQGVIFHFVLLGFLRPNRVAVDPTVSIALEKTAFPLHSQGLDGQHPWKSFTDQVFRLVSS